MNEIKLICDYRESFPSYYNEVHYNDHQDKTTFDKIVSAICELGYKCSIFGGVPELIQAYNTSQKPSGDLFLNVSDGMTEDYSRVQIPVLCDMLRINYSGCNAFVAALTSNKYHTKIALEKIGVKSANSFLFVANSTLYFDCLHTLKYPVIIKPNAEGSSIGITEKSVCYDVQSCKHQLEKLLLDFKEVLVEEYIAGYDATDFIIGNSGKFFLNEVLLAVHHDKNIFEREAISYQDYAHNKTTHIPAEGILSNDIIMAIKKTTEKIVTFLHVYDIARLDYRITPAGEIYFLEVNTVPALHENSQAGVVCRNIGITFREFLHLYVRSVDDRLGGVLNGTI